MSRLYSGSKDGAKIAEVLDLRGRRMVDECRVLEPRGAASEVPEKLSRFRIGGQPDPRAARVSLCGECLEQRQEFGWDCSAAVVQQPCQNRLRIASAALARL